MNFPYQINSFSGGPVKDALERLYSPVTPETTAAQAGVKSIARCQLELWGYANRRARAALAFPGELAQCRTPQSIMAAYASYWAEAFNDGADAAHRISQTLAAPAAQAAAPSARPDAGRPRQVSRAVKRAEAPAPAAGMNGVVHPLRSRVGASA